MCTKVCTKFTKDNIQKIDVESKDVLEVGSFNVNGGIKNYILSLSPRKYIGTDMRIGPDVDIVCKAEDITETFGKDSFDLIISMETFEYIEYWQKAISNLKNSCRTNGKILITTVSKGWGKHDFPFDYWRYESKDMEYIFSDCIIEKIECNSNNKTIFVVVRKPYGFIEKDISSYSLYRIE